MEVPALLGAQHYELIQWRRPERNVRRFFTIDSLVAVRVEHAEVTTAVDTVPRLLVDHPAFGGVRVDHVDGLADPGGYLRQLRELLGDRWIVVEKILAPGETLPEDWPVDGTTGYEHARVLEHALLDERGWSTIAARWAQICGDGRPFRAWELEARREVLDGGLAPDRDRVARVASAAVPDLDLADARAAVTELSVHLRRYRTYLPHDEAGRAAMESARLEAAAARPDLAGPLDRLTRAMATADRGVCRRAADPLAAVDRSGDRQGRRGPGVLAVPRAGVTRRGRRRGRAGARSDRRSCTNITQPRLPGGRPRCSPGRLTTSPGPRTFGPSGWCWHRPPNRGHASSTSGWRRRRSRTSTCPRGGWRCRRWPRRPDCRRTASPRSSSRRPARRTSGRRGSTRTRPMSSASSRLLRTCWCGRRWPSWPPRWIGPGRATALAMLAVRATAPGVPDVYQGTEAFRFLLVDPDNRLPPDQAGAGGAGGWSGLPRRRGGMGGAELSGRRRPSCCTGCWRCAGGCLMSSVPAAAISRCRSRTTSM